MQKNLSVYTDASFGAGAASIANSVVLNDLIIESSAVGYKTTNADVSTHELHGIVYASVLKVIKRKKLKNVNIKVLCDNMVSIAKAAECDLLMPYLEGLRQRGCNVFITYVAGSNRFHNICHHTATSFRLKEVDVESLPKKEAQLANFAAVFKKVVGKKGVAK
jgi:hypothetical protein